MLVQIIACTLEARNIIPLTLISLILTTAAVLQGMAIIANKFQHVFAALCSTPEGAAGARSVNNANVLCMGGNVVSEDEGRRWEWGQMKMAKPLQGHGWEGT